MYERPFIAFSYHKQAIAKRSAKFLYNTVLRIA